MPKQRHAILTTWIDVAATLHTKPQPKAPVVRKLAVGTEVSLFNRKRPYYQVEVEASGVGWIHEDAFQELGRAVEWIHRDREEDLLDSVVLSDLVAKLPDAREKIVAALITEPVAELNRLVRDSAGVVRGDPHALERFEHSMRALIELHGEPPTPPPGWMQQQGQAQFAMLSFDRPPRLPCLVIGRAIERVASAVRQFAERVGRGDPAIVEHVIWTGLWLVGRTLVGLQPLERINALAHQRSMNDGEASRQLAELLASARRLVPMPVGASSLSSLPKQPMPPAATAIAALTIFPGDSLRASLLCIEELWSDTAHAILCCGESYRIDSLSADSPGARLCYGSTIVITGEGFRAERSWHIGRSDTELFSEVFFTSDHGGQIAATEFESWSDTEIRVRVPTGAASGPVELFVLCERTLGGRPLSSRCGLQTRFPAHSVRDARVTLAVSVLESLTIEHPGGVTVVGIGEAPTIMAESCVPVVVRVRAIRAVAVFVTSAGEPVPFPEGDPGEERTIEGRLTFNETDTRSYSIEVVSPCGVPEPREFTVARMRAVHLSLPLTGALTAGTALSGTARVSCPPSRLGLSRLDVRLGLEAGTGVAISPSAIELTGGTDAGEFQFMIPIGACGAARITAEADDHRSDSIRLAIAAAAVPVTLTGTATMNLAGDSRLPTSTSQTVTIGALLGTDHSMLTIASLPPLRASFGTPLGTNTTTISLRGGGAGSYAPATGVISIPLSLNVSHSIAFAGSSVASTTLTTGTATSPSGALRGTGSPVSAIGAVSLVGAGAFIGGWLGGSGIASPSSAVEYLFTITGTFTPVLPGTCYEL